MSLQDDKIQSDSIQLHFYTKILKPTISCLISPEFQYSAHVFIAVSSLFVKAAYTSVIAPFHIHDALSRNIHDATDVIDNLFKSISPNSYQEMAKDCSYSCFSRSSDDRFNKRSNFYISYLISEVG